MPAKFDTKRIYELPILRHNTAAVKLIYQNALGEELSEAFLKKAIEHNRMLAKLVILDNIPVGCIYAHIEHIDESNAKSDAVLVVDFICVLKMYQQRGVGSFVLKNLVERAVKELHVKHIAAYARAGDASNAFFTKNGFEENGECDHSFDDKSHKCVKMTKEL